MDSRFLNVVVNGDSMWPTLKQGSTAKFERIDSNLVAVGQIVLLDHPFMPNLRIIKRIQSIEDEQLFLVGDNPDPTASEDSHNFGMEDIALVLAVLSQE